MANAVTGLIAIVAASRGEAVLAAALILIGILLDGVDGAIARMGGGGGPLGGFLDTLADTITFAVAPAALLATTLSPLWAVLLVASFYLVCVMLRLARFEALREHKHMAYFSGMSSPGGALVIAACYLAGFSAGVILGFTFISGIFMISRIRYPKLRGWLGIVAVALIVGVLLVLWRATAWQAPATLGLIGFMTLYLLAGPFYVLRRFGPTVPHGQA